MHDWNVVVTVHEGGFKDAFRLLEKMGPVARTDFFNTLVMRVDNIREALASLGERWEEDPAVPRAIARFVPATHTCTFQTPEQFEARTREIVAGWLADLAGAAFHVRMRRRGFKGKLSGMAEEQFLDRFLMTELEQRGTPGRIDFADPDCIIAVETVGPRAGLSLWSREELRRFPFLKLD